MKREQIELICAGCNKRAEIGVYVTMAAEETEDDDFGQITTPDDYVWDNEGTLNTTNGHFLCDDCYIKAGDAVEPERMEMPMTDRLDVEELRRLRQKYERTYGPQSEAMKADVNRLLDALEATQGALLDALTDVEFLTERAGDVEKRLVGKGRLDAMAVWPAGSNGPIAIGAYESLVRDVRWAIEWIRITRQRVAVGGSDHD